MKKNIIITAFVLTGCVMDSINIVRLINSSGEDIEVRINYDKAFLDSMHVRSFRLFLQQQSESGKSLLSSVDTNTVVAVYRLTKGGSFQLSRDFGPEPNNRVIHSIVTQSSTGTHSYNRLEISKMMRQAGHGNWELSVK